MTTIYNDNEVAVAFRKKEDCLVIPDDQVGNPLLIAGRVQSGNFPRVVLDKLTTGGTCKVSLGNGSTISLDQQLAKETVAMLDILDKNRIELDIEEVSPKKINLYYGK